MNKVELIQTLKENLNDLIKDFNDRLSTNQTMSDIDEFDTIDPEDLSHQSEAKEFGNMLKVQISELNRQKDILDDMPTEANNAIGYGAIVETNRHNFYIAFATAPFSFNDQEILGISVSSPIYSVMKDKKENEEFEFCGVRYNILKIY